MMSRRRKLAIAALGVLVVAGIAVALGPRITVDPSTMLPVQPPPEAPAELDRWLAEREGHFDDLTPETEKRIVWADPDNPARTPLAVVYIHGFSATRQEIAPVPEQAAERLGANLFATRLRGHGRPGLAMGQPSAERWMEDTIEAMAIGERIGERVLLVGCSTGATLAVWIASWLAGDGAYGPAKRPPIGLVLVSPNFGAADPRASMMTMPWGLALAEQVIGGTHSWTPGNPEQARFWTWSYPTRALATMQSLVDHVRGMPEGAPDLPTLVIWSTRDQVVDTGAIEAWVAAAPERRTPLRITDDVPRGNHVIAGRIMAPSRTDTLVEAIYGFARALEPSR